MESSESHPKAALREALLILNRQTMLLPTTEHLDALDKMHRARYDRLYHDFEAFKRECMNALALKANP